MARKKQSVVVPLESLDLGHLAFFVGMRVNDVVQEQIHAAGFKGLRYAHGFVFQHLLGGPRSIGELARLLEVTQQAASKTVAELERLGYIEEADSEDARVRRVMLSARGLAAVDRSRVVRAELEDVFRRRHGSQALEEARHLLADVLVFLEGSEAVRNRRVRSPR